ncbi:MAG: thiol-disulfide isomerase/thioredoxin [Verrucomicrobiales bacterium]|jgi:thiol-disulfide isomerase/thioredoxin
MMSRRFAGIFCFLALSLTLLSLTIPASANEALAVAIGKGTELVEAKAKVEKIDLPRDLRSKLVRPGVMKFDSYRLAKAQSVDYFLVYFGAHWCPNSKKFTPKLTEFYREQRRKYRNFEVIFVSADKDEEAMLHYMNGYKMPWPAVRFGGHKKLKSLTGLAGRGYPCVALVDAKAGKILAHSYGESRKGVYIGPMKPVEALGEILEKQPVAVGGSVRGAGN